MQKITISDVNKKHLRIIGYLVATWAIGLLATYLTGDERLLGLVPATNYILYAIEIEKKKKVTEKLLKTNAKGRFFPFRKTSPYYPI